MTNFPGILGALSTIGAVGFGLSALFAGRRCSPWEFTALAWLFGTGAVSLALWILGFLLRGIALQIGVTAVCILIGLLGFRRWRKLPRTERKPFFSRKVESVFAALFCLELAAVVYLSFRYPLGWDGLLVWELKARYAFLNGGALPATYFTDATRWFSHPEYPLLLPLTETWFYLWIGDCNQFWIKLIFPLWYGAGMAILMLAAWELSGSRWIGWIAVLLFLFVPSIHGFPAGVPVGYADLPLAVIFLATIFYLLRFMRGGSRDSLVLFVALGATLPWMKREGSILWVTVMLCGALATWRRQNLFGVLLSLLPGVTVIAGWKLFLSAVHALPSRDFVPIGVEILRANIPRLGGIRHELYLELSETSRWNTFWLLVALALLSIIVRERSLRSFVLIASLIVPLACYCASYLFSAWPDYIAHAETSLPRLLIQLTPVGWLLIALALAPREKQPSINNYSTRAA